MTLLAPHERRAPPAASLISCAQALPFFALEFSIGSANGNICAPCHASTATSPFPQSLARAGLPIANGWSNNFAPFVWPPHHRRCHRRRRRRWTRRRRRRRVVIAAAVAAVAAVVIAAAVAVAAVAAVIIAAAVAVAAAAAVAADPPPPPPSSSPLRGLRPTAAAAAAFRRARIGVRVRVRVVYVRECLRVCVPIV